MIKREFHTTRKDNVNLYKTYSDKNVLIRNTNTNELYDVAIDVQDSNNDYEETDMLINYEEEEVQDGDSQENS